MQGEAGRALRCRAPSLPNRPHFDADSIDSAVPLPSVPGVEGAGVIEAIGAGVEGFSVGDRVAYFLAPGSYAAVRPINADALLKVPHDLTSEQVVTVLTKALTAWAGLHGFHQLKAGEIVLVQGASGSVGMLISRWALRRFRRIGARWRQDRHDRCSLRAADH